jgi:hypothetical protein
LLLGFPYTLPLSKLTIQALRLSDISSLTAQNRADGELGKVWLSISDFVFLICQQGARDLPQSASARLGRP